MTTRHRSSPPGRYTPHNKSNTPSSLDALRERQDMLTTRDLPRWPICTWKPMEIYGSRRNVASPPLAVAIVSASVITGSHEGTRITPQVSSRSTWLCRSDHHWQSSRFPAPTFTCGLDIYMWGWRVCPCSGCQALLDWTWSAGTDAICRHTRAPPYIEHIAEQCALRTARPYLRAEASGRSEIYEK